VGIVFLRGVNESKTSLRLPHPREKSREDGPPASRGRVKGPTFRAARKVAYPPDLPFALGLSGLDSKESFESLFQNLDAAPVADKIVRVSVELIIFQ